MKKTLIRGDAARNRRVFCNIKIHGGNEMSWWKHAIDWYRNHQKVQFNRNELAGGPIIGRDVTLRDILNYHNDTQPFIAKEAKPGIHLAAEGDKAAAKRMLLGVHEQPHDKVSGAAKPVKSVKPQRLPTTSGATLILQPDGSQPTEIIYPMVREHPRKTVKPLMDSMADHRTSKNKAVAPTLVIQPDGGKPTEIIYPQK